MPLFPQLNFIFLDPLLSRHLEEESVKFIGTNLLSFVHPDELVRMRDDLLPQPGVLAGVEAAGVFGAVTRWVVRSRRYLHRSNSFRRCRYARIPLIRKLLGCVAPSSSGFEADKFPWLGDDYFDVHLTTSWIAGDEREGRLPGDLGANGAILAFFHAIEGNYISSRPRELD